MKKPAYKIKNVDHLDPFLMSLTSSDNHWMFISSNGALTAGREKADHALFPYITDNLIHTSLNTTGPKTKINIYKNKEKKVVNATKREHIKKIDNIKNDKIKKSLLELSKIYKPK